MIWEGMALPFSRYDLKTDSFDLNEHDVSLVHYCVEWFSHSVPTYRRLASLSQTDLHIAMIRNSSCINHIKIPPSSRDSHVTCKVVDVPPTTNRVILLNLQYAYHTLIRRSTTVSYNGNCSTTNIVLAVPASRLLHLQTPACQYWSSDRRHFFG